MTKPRPAGLDRPGTITFIRVMSAAHVRLYRATKGRVGRNWRIGAALRKSAPICLLTTTGRVSGQQRTVPLVYLADGDRVVVVASQGGLPTNPQWYHNVCANPMVEVEMAGRRTAMLARPADPTERAELWPRLLDLYADFATYQTWTDREIPVVICEPR